MTEETTIANPYVGPRTFSYEQRHLFFGREREARDLTARFLSERLLLFYAQSGAGKSSLLQTRIIPQLREEKSFGVLPVARVSGELLPGIEKVDNIYAFNLMTSIDDGEDPSRLASVSISDFLARLVFKEGKHWVYDATIVPEPAVDQPRRRYALIIDQFEEIISAHPSRWNEREDFFRQLEEAMNGDPNLWVMLTLREDYVAQLDPYANLMTDRLRARFYMDRMDVDAAMEAVQRPANQAGGRPFAPGVAEKLVDDLRQVRRPGQEETVPGQHVEPVQLQVVCYQLWEKLKDRPLGPISMDDLEEAGDVDRALAGFYEDAIEAVLADPSVRTTEGELRNWFDVNLITEAGTRGSVYQGRYETAGIPNQVVRLLANHFLLRRELRAGGAWIELVHDRFVEPIRRANREWLDRQSPFVRAARDWDSRGRPTDLLLADTQLEAAKVEVADNPDLVLSEYLKASEEMVLAQESDRRRRAELERAQSVAVEANARREVEALRAEEAEARRAEQAKDASRLRRRATALIIVSLFAGVTAVAAGAFGYFARDNARVATENYNQAVAWQAAERVQRMTAEANLVAASLAEDEAIAAREQAEANATVAVAAQRTAVAERESLATVVTNLNDVLNVKADPTVEAPTSTPQPSSLSVVLTLLPDQPLAAQVLDAVLLSAPTPTQTPSPTPNAEATSVIATAEAQLAQVQATQTVVAVDGDLATAAAEAVDPQPTSAVTEVFELTPQMPEQLTIEDFESGSLEHLIVNGPAIRNGNKGVLSFIEPPDGLEGSQALSFDFGIFSEDPEFNYIGFGAANSTSLDWSGYTRICFWLRADLLNAPEDFGIQLQIGMSDNQVSGYRIPESYFSDPGSEIHCVSLSSDQWLIPENKTDLTSIKHYAIYAAGSKDTQGIIYVDDIYLE